ncbi:DUF1707 domain-containing protein [Propioniciclava coleopterorum]|uniref:DUF1707 domain-containing protein n=1 Tax=Propioniciclava coleopterorum TaxID=2714937 RepID=A0A6G7Y6J8_9ACTN|nr:DUF1707 domain-containing protein [Propioniciclava coleopterorum]QIK72442.1 DUF1707 domain-containing protein [Propioniciclava coleopterorum]
MTHPVPVEPPGDLWSRFSADPRTAPTFRASDADRDVVVGALASAFQDGRLDADEHQSRLERALSLKTLGDVVPLISDVALAPRAEPAPAPVARREGRVSKDLLRSWVTVALITNIIWLVISVTSGFANYYWPIWPMIGLGIPVVVSLIFGSGSSGRDEPDAIEGRDSDR